ncbi:unnamed protein product [Microthlaspi erraticum]|uniref:Reverse transcriptase Ty1/copia-type domain-containing protein n=1 Tax=Microthlaspi erraticum TaxID=1685480 RepID=A0A6D2L5A1_9BRAS|nr:unnamed protein product [Microthlaspi erraticum]
MNHHGYRCFYLITLITQKIISSRHVRFDQNSFPSQQAAETPYPVVSPLILVPPSIPWSALIPVPETTPPPPPEATPPPPPLPKNPMPAKDPYWNGAMGEEYSSLIKARMWDLVPRPAATNIVRSLWNFRHKFDANGEISGYKARFCANGKSQELGVDCNKTFSPVAKPATVVMHVAVAKDWPLHQLDVKNAFLNGDLEETVYMHQPPGFVDQTKPDHVCILKRSLYGLKQAPRAWNNRFASFAKKISFAQSVSDPSLFIYCHGADLAYLLRYVDDIGLTASSTKLLQSIIASLHKEFEMNCNPCCTPVDTKAKLSLEGEPVSHLTLYRSLASALQYLTFTRADLAYAIQQVCLSMHDPAEPHFAALKRILCYIKGIISHGLHIHKSPVDQLTAYSDVDRAGCPSTRRSTSGFSVFLEDSLTSWSSKQQATVSRSTAEAGYKAVVNDVAETTWLRNLLGEMKLPVTKATIVFGDIL